MKALSLIISAKNLHSSWIENAEPNIKFQVTESGWMEADSFDDWFTNVFVAKTRYLKGPTLLILNGHNSHLSMRIAQTARANQISIVCLPANSTHFLQPLNVAVFSPVKTAWRKIVSEGNIYKWFCSQCLPAVFSTACSQVYMCKSCINESPEPINEE